MKKNKLLALLSAVAIFTVSFNCNKIYAVEYLFKSTGWIPLIVEGNSEQEAGYAGLNCNFILEEGAYVGLLDTQMSGYGTAGNAINHKEEKYVNGVYDMAGAEAIFYTDFDGCTVSRKLYCYLYKDSTERIGADVISR